jgi:hypothetical protein
VYENSGFLVLVLFSGSVFSVEHGSTAVLWIGDGLGHGVNFVRLFR